MSTFAGLLAILLWAALALLGSMSSTLPPFELLTLCFTVSAIIPLCLPKRKVIYHQVRQRPAKHFVIGTLCLFSFHYCYFQALTLAPAVEVSLIGYLWPLFLSLLLASGKARWRSFLGATAGFSGVVVLVLGKESALFDKSNITGYLLAFACALIWAGYSRYLKTADSRPNDIAWQSGAVALLSLVVHISTETFYLPDSISEIVGVILLGLGPVGGAFYLWDRGMKHGDASLLASLSFFTPVLSACLLVAFGVEAWRDDILWALMLIMAGSAIAQWRGTFSRKRVTA